MTEVTDNMQKYTNYREQMGRLSKAMNNGFYLEAIFIEYAIIEDRLESVLRHSGRWNPKPGQSVTIYRKVKLVEKLAEQKKSPGQLYFTSELTREILQWKDDRNDLIHALLKQSLHTEDLRTVAEKGQTLAKTLRTRTTYYNRALERLSPEAKTE